jgi:heptosyltransferase II
MGEHKILILKTGYSEILDKESISRKVSLGDVLRTTPILHLYKNNKVIWVSDEQACPLLEGNQFISRLMPYDFSTRDQLLAERFDTLINLEKFPPICALANQINAWRKYGFRLDPQTGKAEAYDRASEVLTVSADISCKKENKRTVQELLFEMVGAKWDGEEYILGYKPKSKEIYDVGLNMKVGQKWPVKEWLPENWDKLEAKLSEEGIKVSRQDRQGKEVLSDLRSYIEWINSARVIVSNDSLGLHLGLATGKKVIGLFGPTPHSEMHFYGRGEAIIPVSSCSYFPCFEGECKTQRSCMEDISVDVVYEKVKKYIT